MLPDDVRVVSVDDHVVEHPRVWLDRLPLRYREAAPQVERDAGGRDTWLFEGEPVSDLSLSVAAGKDPHDIGMDPVGYGEMRPGCHDVAERIRDMDADGVWAQMCFPTFAGAAGSRFSGARDPELAIACVRAYNDFVLDEWCDYAPDRQIPLVVVPFWDVPAAVAEVERTAALGARSVSLPEAPHRLGLPSYHSDHWDRLLRACEETGLPVSMNLGSCGAPQGVARDADAFVSIALFGVSSVMACVELLMSPVFHRFPGLRVVLSEAGIGWIPYVLERTDYSWERHRFWCDVDAERRPSELFRDHLYGCFTSDRAGIEQRYAIGVEQILFASDYPHADSTWPHTRKVLGEQLVDVPDDEARLIAEGNARRLLRFPA
ncbi:MULTISPECIES: amidohydrolase family protein [unclassified Blastococcus]